MTCSSKIITLAIALGSLISSGAIYDAPLLPGGTINPLSAIILLYCKISKNLDFRVIFFITNTQTQTKNLSILWCLYSDQVTLCSSNFL